VVGSETTLQLALPNNNKNHQRTRNCKTTKKKLRGARSHTTPYVIM